MKDTAFRLLVILMAAFCAASPALRAQEIYYPSPLPEHTFTPSKSQKAVATSTDVVTIALPAAAIITTLALQDWEGLKQGAFTAAATAGATLILKYSVSETRPNFKNDHSFPSGHSAISFASAGYLQRRYGWAAGAPAYALAVYTGWGRVYSKNHHWWDVVAGAAIGVGSAYIFTRPWAKEHELSIAPFTTGETHGMTASFVF